MIIVPEVQISGGQLVTRTGVRTPYIRHEIDPLEFVDRLVSEGAERLHVVDVDAASSGDADNGDLVRAILDSVDIPVQVAGGTRTVNQVDEWLETGAAAVVLGTLAITDQGLLTEVCTRHPGAILANLATSEGVVMIDGWQTATAFRPEDIVYDLQLAGVAGIIHTDIDRFDVDSSASLALTMEIKNRTVMPVFSSGTVQNLEDLAQVHYLPNIHGAIVGHALASGAFSLTEALEVASQPQTSPEPEVETSVAERGIQSVVQVYLASYNRSPAARWWNHDLRQAIAEDNPYVEITIPQEDLEIEEASASRREVQTLYEQAMDAADVVLVVLDGVENEAWTAFECGYARASGKYLMGLAVSPRLEGRSRIESMCDFVVGFGDLDDKQATLSALAREINQHLLSEQADSALDGLPVD
ncbi:MAG: HisA/HisF-related TIM barrel protein [Pseudomonadota bacterium]